MKDKAIQNGKTMKLINTAYNAMNKNLIHLLDFNNSSLFIVFILNK